MKFWKDGFFLTQNEENSRIEITEERWKELLEGQSQGKIIYTDEQGYPQLKEWELSQQTVIEREIKELKDWFDTFYAQHEQKYRRFIALNKNTDEGENPSEKLMTLYEEAEIKRARINELEKEIGE